MPYTLSMGLLWFALALLLGVIIGFTLRSVSARRQVAAVRDETVDQRELERLRARVAELEAVGADRGVGSRATMAAEVADVHPTRHAVQLDDLTVIEGLGPGACELCHGIGILTWADLADTEVSLLRTMLDDAGARYQIHDPSSWPAQARLLAEGRWDEFRELAAAVRDAPPASSSPAEP
jgi:predicted flap endonuclease-1-like 5' DNA nuclease